MENRVVAKMGFEVGRQILRHRQNKGLSQEELAQRAGISRNYISLIERGEARNISMFILGRLALALTVTPVELIGHSDKDDIFIPVVLREFGLEEGLSFAIVDKLAQIPRQGKEPETSEQWRELYQALRLYL